MAIFHSSTKIIARSDGHNAVQAAAYRSGSRLRCERTDQVFNFSRKKEVTHRAILAPPGAPAWVFDRSILWNRVEESESRVNSQLAREIEMSLPLELTHDQQVSLVTQYVQTQFIAKGMVADIAIHSKKGTQGKPDNPHAHILLTMRDVTPDGMGAKRRDWNHKALVTEWRAAWADACNATLQTIGSDERIDHRSHKDRGIERPATVHLGRLTPWNADVFQDRLDHNLSAQAWEQANAELQRVLAEVKQVQAQLLDLTSSIGQALALRDAKSPRTANDKATTPPAGIWTPQIPVSPVPVTAALLRQRANPAHRPTHKKGPHKAYPPARPHAPPIVGPDGSTPLTQGNGGASC